MTEMTDRRRPYVDLLSVDLLSVDLLSVDNLSVDLLSVDLHTYRPSTYIPTVRRPAFRPSTLRPSVGLPSVRRPTYLPSVRRPSVHPSTFRPSTYLPTYCYVPYVWYMLFSPTIKYYRPTYVPPTYDRNHLPSSLACRSAPSYSIISFFVLRMIVIVVGCLTLFH